MKKIKTNINIIKTNINILERQLSRKFKKILFYFIRLQFMETKRLKISIFNRYLIISIVLLFSYLFYLSLPTIYDHGRLQKDITDKLLKEFNLKTSLSANITYKILPTPNFEIKNVLLNTNKDNNFNNYAQIKKMKIYISSKNLFDQNKIEVEKIVISEANIDINNDSYNYLNNYLSKKFSNKKIHVKKSKLFFKKKKLKKNVIALSAIERINLFYDNKNNNNSIAIDGSIYNVDYHLTLIRDIYKKNTTNFKIKFKKLNSAIENQFRKNSDQTKKNDGKTSITFSGSEININYKVLNNLIELNSVKSRINNNEFSLNGEINISPFYYDINFYLQNLNIKKIIKNLPRLKNLLDEKVLLNQNVNGKLTFNIDSMKGIKIFNKAKIYLSILNGKFILDNSIFISDKIGKIVLKDCNLEIVNGERIFKSKILFDISDEKKFYQKFQIPKKSRIKLNNIYVVFEKNFKTNKVRIVSFIINKKLSDSSSNETIDLTELVDVEQLKNLNNWIALKKYSSQLLLETKKLK